MISEEVFFIVAEFFNDFYKESRVLKYLRDGYVVRLYKTGKTAKFVTYNDVNFPYGEGPIRESLEDAYNNRERQETFCIVDKTQTLYNSKSIKHFYKLRDKYKPRD
jgi:hypothetical protein